MDIMWSSVYGIVWDTLESDSLESAEEYILQRFAENTPETVATQCAMVIRGKGTEDAECLMSVTFVHWSEYKTTVSIVKKVPDAKLGTLDALITFKMIDNRQLEGEISLVDSTVIQIA